MGDFFRSPSVLYPKGDHPNYYSAAEMAMNDYFDLLFWDRPRAIRRIAGTVTSLQTNDAETKKAKLRGS